MANEHRNQALVVTTGNPETVSDSPARVEGPGGWKGQLGKYVTVKQPGPAGTPGAEEYRTKTYQYVKMDSTMSVTPYAGAVAWWATKAEKTVTTSSTNRGDRAGIFQYAANAAAGHYCYIQTKGPATVKFIDAVTAAPNAAVGQFVIPSGTDAKADCLAAGTAASYPVLGRTVGDWDAVNTVGTVELEIPETP